MPITEDHVSTNNLNKSDPNQTARAWFGGYIELTEWGIKDKLKIPHRMPLYPVAIPFVGLSLKIYSALLVNWIKSFPETFTYRLADVEPWGGQQTRALGSSC